LTDFDHLGANQFSTLRDPYFGNRCSRRKGAHVEDEAVLFFPVLGTGIWAKL